MFIFTANINVSEFLQLNENTGYFLRHGFLPQSWNNGIVARPGATCLVIAIGSSYPRYKIFKTRSQKKRSGPGNDGIVGFQRILSILNFIPFTQYCSILSEP